MACLYYSYSVFVLLLHFIVMMLGGRSLLLLLQHRSSHVLESIAVSFQLALVLFGGGLFALMLVGVPLSSVLIWSVHALIIVLAAYLMRRNGIRSFFFANCDTNFFGIVRADLSASVWVRIAFVAVVVFFVLRAIFVFWFTLSTPVYFDDVMTNWNNRARNIFSEKQFYYDSDSTEHTFLGGGRAHYPLLLPMQKAGEAQMLGYWNENLMNLLHPLLWLCTLLIFFVRLVVRGGKGSTLTALTFSALLFLMPLMTFHAASGYSDFAVGAYFLLALMFLEDYLFSNQRSSLWISGIFLFGSMFTKNEGVVLFFAPFTCILGFAAYWMRDWRLLVPSLTAFVLLLPHTIVRIIFHLQLNPHPGENMYHPEAWKHLRDSFFNFGHFNVLWYAFPLLVLIFLPIIVRSWRRSLVAAIAVAPLVLTLYTFIFTHNYFGLENQQAINRTLLVVSFALVYALALSAAERWNRGAA